MKFAYIKTATAVAAGVFVLAACGGGGGGGGTPAAPAIAFGGNGVKGPVFSAQVVVRNALSNAVVTGSSCTATARDGSYSCTIPPAATGPFKVELTGGVFCPTEVQVPESGVCPAAPGGVAGPPKQVDSPLSTIVVAAVGATTFQSAPITPFTTVAVQLAGATPANFLTQYQAVATTYGISTNPTDNPLAGAQQVALLTSIGASNLTLAQVLENIGDNEVPTNPAGTNTAQPASMTPDATSNENLAVPTQPPANNTPVTGGTGGTTGGTGGTTGGSSGGNAQAN